MKAVIVTGTAPHHKHLCAQLTESHNVVGVLHHKPRPSSLGKQMSRFGKRLRNHGIQWTLLNVVGQASRRSLERKLLGRNTNRVAEVLRRAAEKYATLNPKLIHAVEDFGSQATLDLLKSLDPDVVLCLGGPIYPRTFIESCPLILNYHSGYSPIYNGTSTIWFAFANGHPHWCGGTLMVMNPEVDGGDILGHFLPAISKESDPAALFLQTTMGAAAMYRNVLTALEKSGSALSRIPQPRALFYFRSTDWTVVHSLKVRRHLRQQTCGQFSREEKMVEYWREPTLEAARESFERTTRQLMWQ